MFKSKRRKLREAYIKDCEEQDRKKQRNRALNIKRTVNAFMEQGDNYRGRSPLDLYIVVRYEDLLRIWDIADHLYEDL